MIVMIRNGLFAKSNGPLMSHSWSVGFSVRSLYSEAYQFNIDWLTDWLTYWLTDLLTDRLSDWLTNWLTDWLTGWLT